MIKTDKWFIIRDAFIKIYSLDILDMIVKKPVIESSTLRIKYISNHFE